jgi:hypothetical protein
MEEEEQRRRDAEGQRRLGEERPRPAQAAARLDGERERLGMHPGVDEARARPDAGCTPPFMNLN